MSDKKRTRHTASFLLSHFLISKESLELTWLTGSLVSILRYMYDIMEITYSQTNICVCNKSIQQIADYARTGRETVKRALPLLVKHELLLVEARKPRAPTHYGIGNLISSRLTMSLELSTGETTRLTESLALGSPRAQETPNWAHCEPHVRKAFKKDSKKKRGSENRSLPLTDDFELTKATSEKIEELGFTEDEANVEIEKFMTYYMGNGATKADWNMVLQNWMIRAKGYKKEKKTRLTKTPDEPKSTVPWYHAQDAHLPRGNGLAAIGKIMENLKPNGHGGSTNGLGTKREGKD